jgi:hypothetical protein
MVEEEFEKFELGHGPCAMNSCTPCAYITKWNADVDHVDKCMPKIRCKEFIGRIVRKPEPRTGEIFLVNIDESD